MPVTQEMSLEQFAARCNGSAAALASLDLSREMKVIAIMARADMVENFQGSHGPDGTPWPPLARPRANSKGADKPLLDTGILQASVTAAAGKGHVETITARSMKTGSNLDYAAVHQYGHTFLRPEKTRGKPWVFSGANGQIVFTRRIRAHQQTVPPRPFAGWSARLLAKVDRVLGERLEKSVL